MGAHNNNNEGGSRSYVIFYGVLTIILFVSLLVWIYGRNMDAIG